MPNSQRQELLGFFDELPAPQQTLLLEFAAFLHSRHAEVAPQSPPLNPIPRPAEESVIAAIKRLSKTYPMLSKAEMLNETSALMTAYVMQGQPAVQVIDELEAVFGQHYAQFLAEQGDGVMG